MPKYFMMFWFPFVFTYFSTLHHSVLRRRFPHVSRQQALVQSLIVGVILTTFAVLITL